MSNTSNQIDPLSTLAFKYKTDKGLEYHKYTPIYDSYLGNIRHSVRKVLELGVGNRERDNEGESLLMWRDYFPNAMIYGVDILDKSDLDGDRIKTFKGGQSDHNFFNSVVFPVIGTPEIIIDDCSHIHKETIKALNILFPKLASGGYYFIEDVDTSYKTAWGGSDWFDDDAETIMNYIFDKTHILNIGGFLTNYPHLPAFDGLEAIHFLKNMILLRK